MKTNKETSFGKGMIVRTHVSAGKHCDLDFKTWWQCYTGWLSRGGGIGKPDPEYYACKAACNRRSS